MSGGFRSEGRSQPDAFGDAQVLAVTLLAAALAVGTALPQLRGERPPFPAPGKALVAARVMDWPPTGIPEAVAGRTTPPLSSALDLNAADAEALQALPGVGPVLAQRILEYRGTHGPFGTPEDLRQVRGIGPRRWERIRPWVRVGEGA